MIPKPGAFVNGTVPKKRASKEAKNIEAEPVFRRSMCRAEKYLSWVIINIKKGLAPLLPHGKARGAIFLHPGLLMV